MKKKSEFIFLSKARLMKLKQSFKLVWNWGKQHWIIQIQIQAQSLAIWMDKYWEKMYKMKHRFSIKINYVTFGLVGCTWM